MKRSLRGVYCLAVPVHVDGACCWYLIGLIRTLKNQHFRVRFGVGGRGSLKSTLYAFINVDNCERPLTVYIKIISEAAWCGLGNGNHINVVQILQYIIISGCFYRRSVGDRT